jgi:uncharacterized membrane protein
LPALAGGTCSSACTFQNGKQIQSHFIFLPLQLYDSVVCVVLLLFQLAWAQKSPLTIAAC